jgi:sortase A
VARRSRLSWLLAIAGALLLAKGSFAVYPFIFPTNRTAEISVVEDNLSQSHSRFKPGVSLFKLSLPRQHAEFTVVEGTTTAALRKGPGHLEGSPLPGQSGNTVVAGHRDTHFRVLKNASIGDEIRVELGEREYHYRITEIQIVSPHDTWVLQSQPDSTITLITCYPFRFLGSAPERYIVQARLLSDP